jgi:hypothetical protein
MAIIRTPDDEIVDQAWYWVKAKTDYGEPHWQIMQAQVHVYISLENTEIQWWETMKDWATDHSDILIVGPRIEEPVE